MTREEYSKSYREQKGISESNLNAPQRTLHYIAENLKMSGGISKEGYDHFQMAISALSEELSEDGTLTVHVSDGSKVKRVLVMGG